MHGLRPPVLAAAVITSIIACSSTQPVQPGPTAESSRVVALGDSLTAGPGLRPEETYPSRLQERIRTAGLPHLMVNAGASGDTTTGALARLDIALVPHTAVLIVALGANDGLQGVPVTTVSQNLDRIIERAKARGIRVLLCGMETPPTRGWQYTLEFHQIYPDIARRHAVPLMPFLLAGVVGRADLNLEDGWHPNAAGAQTIADRLWPHLEPLLR